ncbi:MAG: tetratricopeptide repeat protein [Bacteroidota bacterium]|nr:tetratricopeptide repeat protein [Bacteroidota bacterium]
MIKLSKIFFVLFLLIFVSRCKNDNSDTSPFGEILSQPPFGLLTDSIRNNPSDAGLYYRRAILLKKNNLPEPALADYQKAWSLKKNEEYAVGISNILLDKKTDTAIIFLNDALKILPSALFLQLNLATAYSQQNKTDEALKVCDAILQKEPSQIDALMMKADLLEKKNKIPESIATLENAYQLAPFDAELAYNLAFKYAQNKNEKAIMLSDSLIRMDSSGSHAEPYYFKGLYFSNTANKMKAIELFNLAIQHDYNFLDAHLDKGTIFYDAKKYNEALKTFQLVATISPTNADAYFWMAKCQEALNQKDEAKLNYQRAYGLDKSLTEAKEAADKL